ncbi:MAG: AAA family ATPase [Planctomycetes bacterium]|nr:AAA family ATPase [Planctomycetota bacterium]
MNDEATDRLGPPPLSAADLRWRCDPSSLDFETTAEIEPIDDVIGQETAVEALQFGLESRAAGQNIFVRGLSGTGRMTLLRRLLEELQPTCPQAQDRVFVHNFSTAERPRLISLPPGSARQFKRLLDRLADFVRDDLGPALSADGVMARKTSLEEAAQEEVKTVVGPFEDALKEAGLALVTVQAGSGAHTSLFPVVGEKPVPPEQFEQLHAKGEVDDAQHERYHEQRQTFDSRLHDLNRQLNEVRQKYSEAFRKLLESETRAVLWDFVDRVQSAFPDDRVRELLTQITDDVVDRLPSLDDEQTGDFSSLYRANIVLEHTDDLCPIIVENTPTMTNLLGVVEREAGPMGISRSDHLMIRGGSLLRADGGYLVLDARDVLSEVGAWKVLMRTLRTGRLEIIPPEMTLPWTQQLLNPEPIDVDVRVILLGDAQTYFTLDQVDPDFPQLFKVLADFSSMIDRDEHGIAQYAGVIARIVREEQLLPLHRDAIGAVVEHGARIAERRGKLTARFGRLADLVRESTFLAGRAGRSVVTGDDVLDSVQRTKRRADLPSRRFRELLVDGTVRVQTTGECVGQINGLAVSSSGPLISGFPARITATIGVGSAGVINIEREAALSGAIHTKGFYILGGLLRHLLHTDHPFAFSASIAFEQSYGGIDGDSASGAEICCLLSALTGLPLRQDLAMTGAIDQFGNIMAIGAVNEKIEGFYDVCSEVGLTGTQGVLIPRANAGDLMLRPDVADACAEGRFRVYAVESIHEALELFMARPAGRRESLDHDYPANSVLAMAMEQAHRYWKQAAPRRTAPPPQATNTETDADTTAQANETE